MPPIMSRIMGIFGNMQNMQNQFRQFRQTYQQQYGNANPQSVVQNMLNSGKINQDQFNTVKQNSGYVF